MDSWMDVRIYVSRCVWVCMHESLVAQVAVTVVVICHLMQGKAHCTHSSCSCVYIRTFQKLQC